MSSKFGRRASALKNVANKRQSISLASVDLENAASKADLSVLPPSVCVCFLDGSERTLELPADSDATVSELLGAVQAQLGLRDASDFALFRVSSGDNSVSAKQLRRLSEEERLSEALCTRAEQPVRLLFQRCSFSQWGDFSRRVFQHSEREKRRTVELDLAFIEAVHAIFAGKYLLSDDDAMQIGCMLLQIEFSNFDPAMHTTSFFHSVLSEQFPDPVRGEFRLLQKQSNGASALATKKLIQRAQSCYARFAGRDTLSMRLSLLHFLRSVCPLYESRSFPVSLLALNETALASPVTASLFVTRDSVFIANDLGTRLLLRIPFSELLYWEIVEKNDTQSRYVDLFFLSESDKHLDTLRFSPSLREELSRRVQTERVRVECHDVRDLCLSLSATVDKLTSSSAESLSITQARPFASFSLSPAYETDSETKREREAEDESSLLRSDFSLSLKESLSSPLLLPFVSEKDSPQHSFDFSHTASLHALFAALSNDAQSRIVNEYDDREDEEDDEDNAREEENTEYKQTSSQQSSSSAPFKSLRSKLFGGSSNEDANSSSTAGVASTARMKRYFSKQLSGPFEGAPPCVLLSGEEILFLFDGVDWTVNTCKHFKTQMVFSGSLCVTNYRLIVTSSANSNTVPPAFKEVSVPLAAICKIVESSAHKSSLYFYCRDLRVMRVNFVDSEYKEKIAEFQRTVKNLVFPLADASKDNRETARMIAVRMKLFAYQYNASFPTHAIAWELSNILDDFERLGFGSENDLWQIYDNSDYMLCETYPQWIVLPAHMDDGKISIAASHRSRGRLPAITYRHRSTGAVLSRSSQPNAGLTQRKCAEDELLLNLFRCKGKAIFGDEKLYVLDARGKVAAALNKAAGKGTEDVSVYGRAKLVFGNIENIHVMRSSVTSLLEQFSMTVNPLVETKELMQSADVSNITFYSKVEECGWLKHLRMILLSGVFVAEKLHREGCSVLVHCSDGWDRTAQICGTAQLLLDSYYRTIEGFAMLIEKEWCAFGHKFHDRCGAGQEANSSPDEKSPVFIQFLEVVYELLIQFPEKFEFTEELLIFVANHVTSGLFGNFLGNCDKERRKLYDVQSSTRSIWAYVLHYKARFTNGLYRPSDEPLWPSCAMHRVKIWERLWLKWDLSAHPKDTGSVNWIDNWGVWSMHNT